MPAPPPARPRLPSRHPAGRSRYCRRRARRRTAYRNSASRVLNSASRMSNRGITTMSRPAGTSARRNASRTSRFARLRATAFPSFRVAAIPSRLAGPSLFRAITVMSRARTRSPDSYTAWNSGRRRMRRSRENVRRPDKGSCTAGLPPANREARPGRAAGPSRPTIRPDACGPSPAAASAPTARLSWTSARGSHEFSSVYACWAETYAS